MDSNKRIWCNNYSNTEMELILTLVEEHKKIIECKKTDAVTNREKDGEWVKLTAKFNAQMGTGRTAKQLRMKWDSWKKNTRKICGTKKSRLYGTGGGSGDEGFTNWEERIIAIIGISATGVGCDFDCDGAEINIDEGHESQTQAVCQVTDTPCIIEFDSPTTEVILSNCSNNHSTTSFEQPQPSTSTNPDSGEEKLTWDQWNPTFLKKPVNLKLIANSDIGEKVAEDTETLQKTTRKRPRFSKISVPSKSKENTKQGLLLEKKLELVSLQVELLKKEYANKAKRHELEMEVLKAEFEHRERRNAEKHEIELSILKKKLDFNVE